MLAVQNRFSSLPAPPNDTICPPPMQYLGSSVLDKVVDAGAASQRLAMTVARSFPLIEADGTATLGGKTMSLEFQRKEVKLEVSDSLLSVSDASSDVLFRHSTSRVAFSTVDPENPTRFFYVGECVRMAQSSAWHLWEIDTVDASLWLRCDMCLSVPARPRHQIPPTAVTANR